MMAAEQPDWLKLPFDLLEPIAQGSRDAVAGFGTFRSVCPTWRSAVTQTAAPRLLLPRIHPHNGAEAEPPGGSNKYEFLNAVRDSFMSEITHVGYEHVPDHEEAPSPDDGDPHGSNALSGDGWKHGHKIKIKINYDWYYILLETDLKFSDSFNFAIHIPPGTAAASTDGMVIMMYHVLQGNTGMVFCQPGDAAWAKIANPNSEPDILECSSFTDFTYFEGKILAVDDKDITLVFDATTLQLLYQVDVPPATPNVSSNNFKYGRYEFHCVRLVALPSKVLLVDICVNSSKPESFDIFELSSRSEKDDGGQAWRKVTGNDVGGSYELFLDCYHSTFRDARDGRGTRIYFHHDFSDPVGSAAAYCYNMQDDKIECVYMPLEEQDNGCTYLTRASWFVPTN
ncbi:unnamed protein product [Alopecurus aequalis]